MKCSICDCSEQLFKMYRIDKTAFRANLYLTDLDGEYGKIVCEQCIIDIAGIADHVTLYREQALAKWRERFRANDQVLRAKSEVPVSG